MGEAAATSQPPAAQSVQPLPDLIRVQGLTKTFGQGASELVAVNDIDLTVRRGEFVVVVGPSGCGKSTVMRMLAGLTPPTAGTIHYGDQLLDGPRRDVGVVFQAPILFPWRTVLENVLLPIDVQRRGRPANIGRAKDLLDLVGLADFADRYPRQLSGGMQQRVGIVRALVHDPEVLLMDEPFGALDAMTRDHMNVELQRLWQTSGKTVVFITHSIPEAVFLADRIVVMTARPGEIAEILPVDLPRPRDFDAMSSPEFGAIVRRIRTHFGSHGAID